MDGGLSCVSVRVASSIFPGLSLPTESTRNKTTTGPSILCYWNWNSSHNQIFACSKLALSSVGAKTCKATMDDSGRAAGGDSVLLNEQRLEQELQAAINEENYVEAAKIRDKIRVLHEDSKANVLAANARFYNAFKTGDLSSMEGLWAKRDYVCCVHPGAGGISGYEFVMRSWEYVWVDYEFPLDIEVKDVRVHVKGDVGYVTCMELVKTKGSSWGRQFATNVFEKVDGKWFICIHHASPVDL